MPTPKKEVFQLTPKETEAQECFAKLRDEILNLDDGLEVNEILSIIDDCAPTWVWLTVDEVAAAADASDRPGCPREMPAAEEVQTWLDEDPEVQKPKFLADQDTPRDGFLAYPAYDVPGIILAALRRWGCDPQFTNEEIAMHAAPWSLLSFPPAPAGRSITNGLERIQEGGVSAPIPVSQQMPEPEKKVIAYYLNDLRKGRVIMAEWVPAKSRVDDNNEDFAEYDDKDGEFYWPEGWYEIVENCSDYSALPVEGVITHWEPLPASPYQEKTNDRA